MDVHARLAPGREVAGKDFADITEAPVTDVSFAPGGLLRVTFDGDLTDEQEWRVKNRIRSASTVNEAARLAIREARNAATGATTCACDACGHGLTLALLLADKELGDQ